MLRFTGVLLAAGIGFAACAHASEAETASPRANRSIKVIERVPSPEPPHHNAAPTAAAPSGDSSSGSTQQITGPNTDTTKPIPSPSTGQFLDPGASQSEQPNIPFSNSAGVKLELGAGPELTVGTRLEFRIATEKPGYLVLIDVAADGKITQIYPNVLSLATKEGSLEKANYVSPGKTILVPDPDSPSTNFDLVAAPPVGRGMVVAILSDRPIQIIDLPDAPLTFNGSDTFNYVREATRSLKITPAVGGPILSPQWSFDSKVYVIK